MRRGSSGSDPPGRVRRRRTCRWEVSGRTGLWDGPQGPAGRVHAGQALCCRAYDSNSGCSLAASGLGSGPGCSLSCTSSSGWTASQRGGGGVRGGALRHPPLLQKFKPDWGRPHARPLAAQPAGPGAAGAPPPQPCFLPSTAGQGQRPRAFCVPHRHLGRRGPPHRASSRLCRPSWTGNTPIGLGCQLPVPGLGNELLAAPHDSSPGRLRPRPAGPHPAQHLRLPGSTCDPAGEHASPSRSGPVLQAGLRAQAAPAPLSWGRSTPGTSPIRLWEPRAGPHPNRTGQGSQWLRACGSGGDGSAR